MFRDLFGPIIAILKHDVFRRCTHKTLVAFLWISAAHLVLSLLALALGTMTFKPFSDAPPHPLAPIFVVAASVLIFPLGYLGRHFSLYLVVANSLFWGALLAFFISLWKDQETATAPMPDDEAQDRDP